MTSIFKILFFSKSNRSITFQQDIFQIFSLILSCFANYLEPFWSHNFAPRNENNFMKSKWLSHIGSDKQTAAAGLCLCHCVGLFPTCLGQKFGVKDKTIIKSGLENNLECRCHKAFQWRTTDLLLLCIINQTKLMWGSWEVKVSCWSNVSLHSTHGQCSIDLNTSNPRNLWCGPLSTWLEVWGWESFITGKEDARW